MPKRRTQIHLYCLCWNDARLLPFFLRHYSPWVDRFFVYDNGSTDASLKLLAGDERVTVRHFDTPGDSFVAEELRLSETIWKESRGTATWVIVIDIDEFLYHPDPRAYLDQCWSQGITAIQATAYEMIAESFPGPGDHLASTITRGVREPTYDKLCIFDPNAIDHTNYTPGRHKASPVGQVRYPATTEFLLLHYKALGLRYLVDRSAELSTGLGPGDIAREFGHQYLFSQQRWTTVFWRRRRCAAPVPGLAANREPGLHFPARHQRLDPLQAADHRSTFCLPPNTDRIRILSHPGVACPDKPDGDVAISRLGLRTDTALLEIPQADPQDRPHTGPMTARWRTSNARVRLPEPLHRAPILEVELIWPLTPGP